MFQIFNNLFNKWDRMFHILKQVKFSGNCQPINESIYTDGRLQQSVKVKLLRIMTGCVCGAHFTTGSRERQEKHSVNKHFFQQYRSSN